MSRTMLLVSVVAVSACGPSSDVGPTWYGDVQPLVTARCGGCHVEGGVAPFALTTYAQAKTMSRAMLKAVESGSMPPWMPSADCAPLKDTRSMPPAELDVLRAWVDHGVKEGIATKAQALKEVGKLPWVDLTLAMSEPYLPVRPAAKKSDDYRCFPLDPQLTGNKDVIGFEVVPGTRRQVHHVLFYSIPKDRADELDARDPGAGWTCFGGPGVPSPKLIGGWVPGSTATRFPGATGVRMFQGDVIVMQVHYNLANGDAEPDLTTVNLQFAKAEVQYTAQLFPLVQKKFAVPPGASGYSAEVTFESPFDAQIWGFAPHMHLNGVSIKVELTPAPSAESTANTCLVDIPKWDFHWQQFYFLASPTGLPVKQGQGIKLTCTWDNTTTSELKWGESTTDEMCLSFLYMTGGL